EGKLDEAERLFLHVVAIEKELLGPDDLQVLILMHNLSGLERDRAQYQQAEVLEREVIERADRTLAHERPERGLFLAGLARTLQSEKRYADAAGTLAQARANLVAAYGPSHARVLKLDQLRTEIYREWGRPVPE